MIQSDAVEVCRGSSSSCAHGFCVAGDHPVREVRLDMEGFPVIRALLGSPWSCGSDGYQEANNVTKPGAVAGGVLCCRD